MYLSNLKIENFRAFGSEAAGTSLDLTLSQGLNLLVGENDAGKTAVVDAIRHLLWTTSQDFHRLTEDDFHVEGDERARDMKITAVFEGLSLLQRAAFLEYLTIADGAEPSLSISLLARRQDRAGGQKGRASVFFRAGADAKGPPVEGALREFLRCTYLKPLRDAEGELSAGRSSRLSQILKSHPDFSEQAKSDWSAEAPTISPTTLVGIMKQAEHLIRSNSVVQAVHTNINSQFLEDLSLGTEILTAAISVARSADLQQILEKLELALDPKAGVGLPTRRGLGLNNVLFMATELLLLGASDGMPLLLIEEPEAHLHPQMQLRLMEMLEARAAPPALPPPSLEGDPQSEAHAEPSATLPPSPLPSERVQVIVTTHSPTLASKADVETLTLITQHQAFSLAATCTQLDASDYSFLRRFLDATKANLFFSKAVVVVEGDGENIILPALAKALGRSFSKYGVSVVSVGHRGLFRYSRIFQRNDERKVPIRVACVADRDVPPAEAKAYVPPPPPPKEGKEATRKFADEFSLEELQGFSDKLRERDGEPVQTFVSPSWTLEHDMALDPAFRPLVHRAIRLARRAKNSGVPLSNQAVAQVRTKADGDLAAWTTEDLSHAQIAAKIYEPLFDKKASKAETAQYLADELERANLSPTELVARLPAYLVSAIEYVTAPVDIEEAI
ncbi:AAA family ATPase [Brevundimonas bullata]|uniref:ATP-dependent nuclease n=1 Tax=Brevundimonas bullata TaxID=13160 RepID=UPI000E0AC5FF|nr:AAA family ATPase [Brevundimonas bullata]WQE37692.1 AAA family ATPase [Brevundimonas bullata]